MWIKPRAAVGAPTLMTATTAIVPVIHRTSAIDWEGNCYYRYINGELCPIANLKLTGRLWYNIDVVDAACTLPKGFLVFLNSQSRHMMMGGFHITGSPMMCLHDMEEGPNYMTMTELYPETLLVNEVEAISGRVDRREERFFREASR